MANTSFAGAPYFDDAQHAIDNNFVQVLFRPGYAVQARELTQLQDILQNQISNLGSFVFQDGSPVYGGHISFDGTPIAISLQPQFSNTDINISDFFVNGEPTLIINSSGAVTKKAYVVAIDATQTNPTLIVKYLTGNVFEDGDVIQVATGVQTQGQMLPANSASPASVASISQGIFYSGGYFVTVNPQTVLLSSSNNAPTYRIGLSITDAVIDEVSDTTLLDPAQGSFNYQAPGATRYQYNLQLDKRDPSSTDDSAFYQLLMLENGLITSQVEYPVFGDIMNTLAARTYDQSGDFTVKPFIVTTDVNPANANQYTLIVSPGKAYVKGFEFETVGTTRLFADKALSTANITDYSMSLNFGEIITVNNVFGGNVTGIFDITQFQTVDMHVVPSGNINTTNLITYTATKMGTCGIRDIEFLGLNDYYAYIVSANITPNVFTATGGNLVSITLPVNYSNLANAYANCIVTVNTGNVSCTTTVTSYNQSTRVAMLSPSLPIAANATSNCSLKYGLKDMESMVVFPTQFASNVYATQNLSAGLDACMDVAVAGKDVAGNTVVQDTQFNIMVYALPDSYIAQNTISNASYYARKNLWSQTFTSGNLTISTGSGLGSGEILPYGFVGGYIPDVVANSNFLVVVRNSMSSNLSNGQIIQWNKGTVPAGNGVFQTDSAHATIAVGANNSFIADVIFTVQETNAQTTTRRSKTLVGNTSNTSLLSTDSYLNGSAVIGLSPNVNSVYIDSTNGYCWFTSYYDQALSPGARQSLYTPDVFNVIKVFDSGNPIYAPNLTNAIDITQNYYLDSGQRDNFYDHAGLILKGGVNPPSGQTVVFMQFFNHDSVLGFFDADSYSANVYAQDIIPYYQSPSYGLYSLRDSIDFRPTRVIGSSTSVANTTFKSLKTPQPNFTMTLSYSFYLPRIDKLSLSKDKTFVLSEGIPSQYPVAPADSDDSMTLYIVNVPAFTANVKGISLQYLENKRYTMKDIGSLDNRIQTLETYSSLNQLESKAANEKILYQDGVTAKDQYGIIADDFGSFAVADVQSIDLRCYMQEGTLSPFKVVTPFTFNLIANTGGAYQKNKKTISLAFTETPAIIQNTATTNVAVQPYLFGQFTGSIELTPDSDYWFSANLAPQIIAPMTSNPDLPPLPLAPQASALIPVNSAVQTPAKPTIASSLIDTGEFWTSDLTYLNNGYSYLYKPVVTSYGVVSAIANWFGVKVKNNAISSSVSTIGAGASIQLSPGSKLGTSLNAAPINLTTL